MTSFNYEEWSENWDECCIVCGKPLPENPKPRSVQEQGYCSHQCYKFDGEEYESSMEGV